jgi:hypothetical protein
MSGIYDVVQNPIPKSDLFATPASLGDVQEFIAGLPKGQQANANLVLMYTLNICHKLVEDKILSKEIFAQ